MQRGRYSITMTLRTTGSVLVVFLCSVAATSATKCFQKSQVIVSPIDEKRGPNVTLTCNSSCTLTNTSHPTYIWYRNGQHLDGATSRQYFAGSYYSSSYSCALKGFEDLHSPAVCVLVIKCFSVTYTNQSICALEGSTVNLPCKYEHSNKHTVVDRSWYVQKKPDKAPTILSSLSEYEGRVEYLGNNMRDCTLRITDLRESDSAEYKFRFKTQFVEWGNSLPGSTLTVTGLQVQKVTKGTNEQTVTLTCSSTCTLTDNHTYTWYKNGQSLDKPTSCQNSVTRSHTNSYSCAVSGLHSPAVCVLKRSCMAVTYSHQSICALKGSTVNISCSFNYPSSNVLKEITWFNKWKTGETKNVSQDPQFAGRVEYYQTTDKDSTLRITDLRETDSAEYKFRFKTNATSWGYSYPGTTLTVTDLKVSPARKDGKVTLTCITICTLTDNHTYIWYKNGQRLTNKNNFLYLGPVIEDAGYSCAVKGHEDLRSPEEKLTVRFVRSPVFPWVPVVVVGSVLTAAALLLTLRRCKGRSGATEETQTVHPDSNSDTYTAVTENRSPDNGRMATVHRDPSSDTYTALNMRTRSPDYDTLETVRDSHNEADSQRHAGPSDYENWTKEN